MRPLVHAGMCNFGEPALIGSSAARHASLVAGHYDPMLTTPPGTYSVSLILYRAYAAVVGDAIADAALGAPLLRLTNALLAGYGAWVTTAVVRQLQRQYVDAATSAGDAARASEPIVVAPSLVALLAVTFPVHFFFVHLYYTDAISLWSVLTLYLLAARCPRPGATPSFWRMLAVAVVRDAQASRRKLVDICVLRQCAIMSCLLVRYPACCRLCCRSARLPSLCAKTT